MLERTKYFLFLFLLQCPPSLLIPLVQHVVEATALPNISAELEINDIEKITPKNVKAPELIQQIDVKDNENNVISQIKHVAINYDPNNGNNGHKNVAVNKTLVSVANVTVFLDNAGVTNPSNGLTPLPLTNASGNALVDANVTDLHRNNATNVVTNNVNVTNEVSVVEDVLETIDEDENLINSESEIAWRIGSPTKGKNKNTLQNGNSNTTVLNKNNEDGSEESNDNIGPLESNNNNLPDDEYTKEKHIFLLLNTGTIDGISVNSPGNKDILQTNLNKNVIESVNTGNSTLMTGLVNSTINNVLSKIIQQNHHHTGLEGKNLFLILNSGRISNFHVELPVLEKIAKNTILKARLRRHLNEIHNTTVESVTLEPSNDESTPVIEMRTSPPGNTTADENSKEEIPSAEAPNFRFLISDKIKKLHQVPKTFATVIEPKTTKDQNLLEKLINESPLKAIDLNQMPLNDLFGEALNFLRLKRTTDNDKTGPVYAPNKDDKTVNAGNGTKSNTDLNTSLLAQATGKSLGFNIFKAFDTYQRIELVCPLSVIAELYTENVLKQQAEEIALDGLQQILSAFLAGKEGIADFAFRHFSELPVKLKLELSMLHGKTEQFIEKLNKNVDSKRCSVS